MTRRVLRLKMFRKRTAPSATYVSRIVSALLCGAAIAGCQSELPDPRPNLVIITFDTTRADHCSVNGYGRDTTPVMESLAREGIRFEIAYAPTSTTAPSHATLFTGLDPRRHGVIKNGVPLPEERETLAEIFSEAGYQTAAFVSSFVLNKKFGLAQGFDIYDDAFTPAQAKIKRDNWEGHTVTEGFDRRAEYTSDRAVEWLQEARDTKLPFFLFVHYFDPHAPYEPLAPFHEQFDPLLDRRLDKRIAAYDGEIAYTDAHLARLLDALEKAKIFDDTLVIVTADHGEGLGEHGHMEHGVNIYEETVRIPLVAAWPSKLPQGTTLTGPVTLADVAPTVLALFDLGSESESDRQNLARAWRGDETFASDRPVHLFRRRYEPTVVVDTPVAGELHGIRVGHWKLIIGEAEDRFELYDLAQDPQELSNVADEFPEKAAELAALIAAEREKFGRIDSPLPEIDAEDAERLRALGYVD